MIQHCKDLRLGTFEYDDEQFCIRVVPKYFIIYGFLNQEQTPVEITGVFFNKKNII